MNSRRSISRVCWLAPFVITITVVPPVVTGRAVTLNTAANRTGLPSASVDPQPDVKQAAETAVRILLSNLGDVSSVSFEPFVRDERDQSGENKIRSGYAASVVATEDLVVAAGEVGWQTETGFVGTPVANFIAPKGTRLVVLGTVSGKSVAGSHVFDAMRTNVAVAPGEVLRSRDGGAVPNTAFILDALNHVQLLSSIPGAVIAGSPEHRTLVAEAARHDAATLENQHRRNREQRDREVAEVVDALGRYASSQRQLIVVSRTDSPPGEWMFSTSLSDIQIDGATGVGSATMTNWESFQPSVFPVAIRKLEWPDERGGSYGPRALAFDPEVPGNSMIIERIEGDRFLGKMVGTLATFDTAGQFAVIRPAEPETVEAITEWQAVTAEVGEIGPLRVKVLPGSEVQQLLAGGNFRDAPFMAARYFETPRAHAEAYRSGTPQRPYDLSPFDTFVARSSTGRAADRILVVFTAGSMAWPEVSINGMRIGGLDGLVVDTALLIELDTPTAIHEFRLRAENPGGAFSFFLKLCGPDQGINEK